MCFDKIIILDVQQIAKSFMGSKTLFYVYSFIVCIYDSRFWLPS